MSTKQIEALKLALEFIKANTYGGDDVAQLMDSIREALAEPDYKVLYEKAAQQYNELAELMDKQPAKEKAPQSANCEAPGWISSDHTRRDDCTTEQPSTVPDNSQEWRRMDGATAYWLIQRHADGWADIGKMMGEWLAANQAQPAQQEQKPFGYIKPDECDYEKVFSWNRNERTGYTQEVYTAPQPRQWQGLTDEDLFDIASVNFGEPDLQLFIEMGKLVQEELKEKNT